MANKEQNARYYQEHREAILARQKETLTARLPYRRALTSKWKVLHRNAVKAQNAAYYQAHPEVARHNHLLRRTRKTQAGGTFTQEEWLALCAKYNNECVRCMKQNTLEPDHVIPVCKGGTSNIGNIQPLCMVCNRKKHDKTTDYRNLNSEGNSEWKQELAINWHAA